MKSVLCDLVLNILNRNLNLGVILKPETNSFGFGDFLILALCVDSNESSLPVQAVQTQRTWSLEVDYRTLSVGWAQVYDLRPEDPLNPPWFSPREARIHFIKRFFLSFSFWDGQLLQECLVWGTKHSVAFCYGKTISDVYVYVYVYSYSKCKVANDPGEQLSPVLSLSLPRRDGRIFVLFD